MSQLSMVFSAAFAELITEDGGRRYAELYEKYMGVRRAPPELVADCRWVGAGEIKRSSSLAAALDRNRLLIGALVDHPPYYFVDRDGTTPAGFEYELGNELARRIGAHYGKTGFAAEWCPITATTAGDGNDNLDVFKAMNRALQDGLFDLVMAGIIDTPDGGPYTDIDWTSPTMSFYWSMVYTGRGDLHARLAGAKHWTRDQLCSVLAKASVEQGALLVISTRGGPSEEAATSLREGVEKAGGTMFTSTTTVQGLGGVIGNKWADFVLGDALALSGQSRLPSFPEAAEFLGVDVGTDEYFIKAFTIKGR